MGTRWFLFELNQMDIERVFESFTVCGVQPFNNVAHSEILLCQRKDRYQLQTKMVRVSTARVKYDAVIK